MLLVELSWQNNTWTTAMLPSTVSNKINRPKFDQKQKGMMIMHVVKVLGELFSTSLQDNKANRPILTIPAQLQTCLPPMSRLEGE